MTSNVASFSHAVEITAASLQRVEPAETYRVVALIADRFVERPSATFWWEALREPHAVLPYGSGAAGFEESMRLLAELVDGAPCMALVGLAEREAEVPEAWSGALAELAKVLGECPPIELAVSTSEAEWVVFDTHHDALVVAGTPPGLGKMKPAAP